MPDLKVKELSFKGNTYKICYKEDYPQDASWFSHEDESAVRDRDWDIKPGDVVFDIGSAYGSYALTALASGAARVVCWNPNREENVVLAASAELNGWTDRIDIVPHGLWSEKAWLRDTDLHVAGEQLGPEYFLVGTLDREGRNEAPTWMKLDVEGAEFEVLSRAEDTILSARPRILVELHLFKDGTLGTQVTELLASYEYRKVSEHPYHSVAHALYEPVTP